MLRRPSKAMCAMGWPSAIGNALPPLEHAARTTPSSVATLLRPRRPSHRARRPPFPCPGPRATPPRRNGAGSSTSRCASLRLPPSHADYQSVGETLCRARTRVELRHDLSRFPELLDDRVVLALLDDPLELRVVVSELHREADG